MLEGTMFWRYSPAWDSQRENLKKQLPQKTVVREKRQWTWEQWKELKQMNLIHLECLRMENQRVAFKALAKPSRNQPYIYPLRSLNQEAQGNKPDFLLESEFLNSFNTSVGHILQNYTGKSRSIRLVLLVENLIYLIERAEYYSPSEPVFKRLLQTIPPKTRLEARIGSA